MDEPGEAKRGTRIGFTPARRAAFLEAYRRGLPIHTCCKAAGIQADTFGEWVRIGEGWEPARPVSAERRQDAIGFAASLREVEAERDVGIAQRCRETIVRAAQEGFVKTKVKRVTRPDGSQEITEESDSGAPIWQSAAWYLERSDPKRFGTGQDRLASMQAENGGGLPGDAEDFLPRLRMLLASSPEMRREVREMIEELDAEV